MRTSTSATLSSSRRSKTSCNRRILPLVRDAGDPASHLELLDRSAYYVIEHGGYDPYLFDNPSHPVIHRRDQAGCAALEPTLPSTSAAGAGGVVVIAARAEPPFDLIIEQQRRPKQRLSPGYGRLNARTLAHSSTQGAMRLQLFATQLAVLPFAISDWGTSPRQWYSLPACIGLYALWALPLGLIGAPLSGSGAPWAGGQGCSKDANRPGSSPGSPPPSPQGLVVLWADQFNARQLAALLAGLGLIPSALVGIAAGLVVRRITLRVVPGTHGTNTTWLALLGEAGTITLIAHRYQRPDLCHR